MKALHIHVGPRAMAHLRQWGLNPRDVRMIPAAAGGPKGLALSHLDQDLFGRWLPAASPQSPLHLVGASIGAWRMAAAMMPDPALAFQRLANDYIAQDYPLEPGQSMPSAQLVSEGFAQTLSAFFGSDLPQLLVHPKRRNWHLHVLTSRGKAWLNRPNKWGTMAGFAGLAASNLVGRRWVSKWLERTVLSAQAPLPFGLHDQCTQQVRLTPENFLAAVQASCAIPFWLEPVLDIPGTLPGAHWDGGLIDYHLHWPYASMQDGLVLYPHFQQHVVPGWLDKSLPWRHRATPALDNLILLAPNPEWIKTLPNSKLPCRADFKALPVDQRKRDWTRAVAECERLADEWRHWLDSACPTTELKAL
jgi:hypothetical protein